jgi:predicted enzyme related to lactoylglutathione lyase
MRVAVSITSVIVLTCLHADIVCAQSSATSTQEAPPMEKVLGIGGFFFRASDPKALAEWYETHLGVNRTPESYGQEPWRQTAGPTVFAPFPKTTRYFGADDQPWMINFRVRDLDAMVSQLRRAGIDVQVDPESYPNGRFARLKDPEGNPVQLWESRQPGETR